MRKLLLTGYDEKYAELGAVTTPAKEVYALRHGYEFRCVRGFDGLSHPSWQKLGLIAEGLVDHEWVFWSDADTVLTNPALSVERHVLRTAEYLRKVQEVPEAQLIASVDWAPGASPWNAGNMVLMGTPEMQQWIRIVEEKGFARWGNQAWWDQSALQQLLPPGMVVRLPRRVLMAVPRACRDAAPEPWEPGDFLAHCTTDDADTRLRVAREIAAQVNPYAEPDYDLQEMDWRHVCVLRDFLRARPRGSMLEIGCWKGRTTRVLVEALADGWLDHLDLCDVSFKPEIREMTNGWLGDGRLEMWEMPSKMALQHLPPPDVALVDGCHSLDTARDEWTEIGQMRPDTVILHDINATAAGYDNCEGPPWMMENLLKHGYTVMLDKQTRDQERTNRGFAICMRSGLDPAFALAAFRKHGVEPETISKA